MFSDPAPAFSIFVCCGSVRLRTRTRVRGCGVSVFGGVGVWVSGCTGVRGVRVVGVGV